MPSISTASLIQSINLGAQSNDGTGDAIRDAFNKVNQNFATIAGVLGVGSGLYFTKLIDTPHVLSPNKLITTDATGLTLTQVSLVGLHGIQLTLNQTTKTLTVDATVTNVVRDPNPILANNLSANYVYRGTNFADPVDDQDLATKKWIHDNFLNRDGNFQYISSTNPITGANVTSTIVEGSTLRHNIQLIPSGANTSTNTGKTITVFTASGTTSTVDISRGQWLPSHLTRKDYVDTKISLQGISTVDPATGQVNPGFGQMTGGLELFRDPAQTDSPLIAATKGYVDQNSPLSKINFYISLAGNDARYDVPSYKRGRSLAYAFKSISKAAQAAIESQAVSEIKLGPYQRFITTDGYQSNVQISSTATSLIPSAIKLNVTYNGGLGTDPFRERSIRPGMFIQGADSNAMANILNISLASNSNVEEYYEVTYVDYALTFTSAISANKLSGDVTFTLFNYNLVPIPDFWIGYIFQLDQNVGGQSGKIVDVSTSYDPNGNVYDTFTVRMDSDLTNLNTISGSNWHVYSGYFIKGENLRYGQKYNKLEISLIVESGEYNEQFPIRMADNVSLRGDEFRRTIFKPAYVNGTARASISTSPWTNIWFRRDAQVDGLITCSISTVTDYAATLTQISVTPASVTNDATTGVTTFTLNTSSAVTAPGNWPNKIFAQYNPDGKTYSAVGTITAVNQNTFYVNLAENFNNQRSIGSTATIASGSWHVFDPINFGYHYLRDPSRPANYIAGPNSGGYVHAYNIIKGNLEFLKNEVWGYVNQKYSGQFVLDAVKCKRDIGIILNALAYDLKFGDINQSINAADSFVSDPSILSTSYATLLPLTIDMVGYMNTLLQRVLINLAPTTKYSVAQQTLFSYNAESVSLFTIADLTSAMQAIINKDPSFNPGKYNDELDVFLMNDATILRYCGGQGHGGFMKVLDPEGQIKSKSPYTQTCSSFSRSTGHHTFAGGMLVDGFCGNLPLTVTTPTQAAQSDNLGNLIFIPVSGLVRKPQFPCFFIDKGISYEVDYMNSYNALAGTAVLALNSNNPGGFQSVSIQNAGAEFQANRDSTNPIYCTFINPGIAGAISAKGFVTTDANGLINGFNVTFPGKGYVAQPTIIVGQATFNFTITGGVITTMTVNNGGSGYTTGTKLTISSPGGGGTTAIATITSVAPITGAITAVALSYGGSGYSLSVTPTVTFGLQSFSAVLKNGFVGPLPYNIELNTAGNRSMLANDYTQINDLGYGVFATNGGLIENVSMFTYYNWTSYYALNGAQVRSITGSSCYGFYGLVSEGSNPLEIPTPVTLPDQLTQVATVYNQAPYQNTAGGAQFYVTIDPTYGYAPYAGSEVEVNHYGVRKIYNIQNASQVVGNVYVLSIDTTAIGGIYSAIPDGTPVTIRIQTQFRLYGLNASAITRPSTVLTLNEESTYIYRVLNYINLGSDYVLAESEEAYDFISVTPYTVDSNFRQGIGRPNFVSTGSGYTTTATWTATIATPTIKSAVVLGNQGTPQIGVSQLNIASASGNIHPGMTITGAGVLSGQKVLWVSTDTTVVQTTLAQAWTASTTLSFIGSTATAYATSNQATGYITGLVITDPGVGYDSAPVVTIWPSPVGVSGNASVTVSMSGMVGSTVIKTANIKSSDIARINTGLTASTPYYYQFGYEGQMYKITKYVPAGTRQRFNDTSVTGGSWNEIEFTPIQSGASTLTKELWYSSTQPLYAGIEKNQGGSVTIQISTMRATGHDMLNVGTGGYASSKYPNDLYGPPTYLPDAGKITKEVGKGRVYSVTTDQDGNFRVGKYFSVDQGRGTVTINAPIALSGISKLSFKKGVEIDNFSIDETMAGNSPRTVPTESAIVGYVGRRLGFDTTGNKTSALGPGAIATNGVIPMAAPLNMAGNKVTNVGTPTGGTDAANKDYADDKISKRGTNELFYKGGQGAGVMSGSLILNGDPKVVTHVLASQVSSGDGILYLDSNSGIVPGMQVTYNTSGGAFNFIGGTTVTNVSTTSNTVSISPNAIGTIAPSTTIYFDSVFQAANKRYVDSQAQMSNLRDVSLVGTADADLLMFAGNITATSSTVTPLYNSARQVVNVANSGSVITNTTLGKGGGSDVTITRNGRFATIKLVGGQGSTNPITDYHINSSAAIAQSKLALQDAKALYNTAPLTLTQSLLGVATFNSTQFSATNGWVSLNLTSDLTTQSLIPSANGTYNLGSTGNKFGNVYANTLYGAVDAGQIGGTLAIEHGGTAAGSASGALSNILAGATNSPDVGYVLKASGSGQYFWGQELGGGLQTGTKILTQRLGTTVASAGQTVFTAPTYAVGAGQLRVYINGVRQSADTTKAGGADYTENSTTTFTVGQGLAAGDYVLAEVDGYYFFQVNANSVAYTASFPLTANNLQDAVDQLNANKYSKTGGTITGDVTLDTGKSLYLAAGTTLKPALKLISGSTLTTPQAGAIEFDGTNLYFTQTGNTRQTLASVTYVNAQGFLKFADNITSANTSTYSTYAVYAQIAQTSTYAAIAPWNGLSGTPPSNTVFANGAAYLTSSGTIDNAVTAASANNLNSANSYQVNRLGIGGSLGAAYLTVAAGTTVQSAIQLNVGSTLTNAVVGAVEWNGENLFITSQGPTRHIVAFQDWVTSLGYQTSAGNVQQSNQATTATFVVNGVYTTGSYPNPTWITSLDVSKVTNGVSATTVYSNPAFIGTLDAGKLTGTIPSSVQGGTNVYIGTTAVALNRTSANLALTGISSVQFPGSSSGNITLQATAVAGSNTLTLPAQTGSLAVTGDSFFIGSTSVANNRATGNLALAGITTVTMPGATSGNTILQPSATGSPTVTLPSATGTLDLVGATFYIGSTAITNNRSSAAQSLTGITSIDGTAANVANALTFKNDGSGDAADSTYNGGATRKISYNSIGAASVGQTFYIGTTAMTVNRVSGAQTGASKLTGVDIDGNAGSVNNGVYTNGSYANPSWITNINYNILNGTVTTWNQDTTGTAAKANQLLGEDGSQRSAVYSANTAYSIVQRNNSGNITAAQFTGNATSANYADLAEKYTTDVEYAPGTVVMVGGNEEVTAVTGPDCWVLGVISTNPAHLMNAGANGQPIALTGRVPVKLNVAVKKGDAIYPDVDGGATTVSNGRHPFGFALTTTAKPGLVECAIK